MEQILIVDGYNIIGAWPELRKLRDTSLEEARVKLIGMMTDYQAYKGSRVYIVFDAYKVPGLGGKETSGAVSIRYTKENESADELVERLVGELSGRRKQVYVATSDSVEQHVSFGKGALRLSARELAIEIEIIRKEIRTQISAKDKPMRNSLDNALNKDIKLIFERWRREK
ncbi:NYN domain-containing protein [Paenibacillus turpanensis]|uniref:NYN domain-containing protein n=1 Tax=Paenibacillus turpanensis TaxID=2689078 RepID=UPI00140969DE|nr:NYN domain-containing protein [Paenibacillus turpanensis]